MLRSGLVLLALVGCDGDDGKGNDSADTGANVVLDSCEALDGETNQLTGFSFEDLDDACLGNPFYSLNATLMKMRWEDPAQTVAMEWVFVEPRGDATLEVYLPDPIDACGIDASGVTLCVGIDLLSNEAPLDWRGSDGTVSFETVAVDKQDRYHYRGSYSIQLLELDGDSGVLGAPRLVEGDWEWKHPEGNF